MLLRVLRMVFSHKEGSNSKEGGDRMYERRQQEVFVSPVLMLCGLRVDFRSFGGDR